MQKLPKNSTYWFLLSAHLGVTPRTVHRQKSLMTTLPRQIVCLYREPKIPTKTLYRFILKKIKDRVIVTMEGQ